MEDNNVQFVAELDAEELNEVKEALRHAMELDKEAIKTTLPLSDEDSNVFPEKALRAAIFYGDIIRAFKPVLSEENVELYIKEISEAITKAFKKPRPKQSAAFKTRRKAQNSGAVMTLGGHVGSFSQEQYTPVLTSDCLAFLEDDINLQDVYDEQKGKLTLYSLDGKLSPIKNADPAPLMAVCKAIFDYDVDMRELDEAQYTIPLYLPAICRELCIDARTDNRSGKGAYKNKRKQEASTITSDDRLKAIEKRLLPFDRVFAKLDDGSYYRLCTIDKYDKESEVLYISSPLFFHFKRKAQEKENPLLLTTLFKANIATERNTAAVELANRILAGIVRRGVTKPDAATYKSKRKPTKRTTTKTDKNGAKSSITEYFEPDEIVIPQHTKRSFTWTATFESLINDCPQLRSELESIKNAPAEIETSEGQKKPYRKTQAYNAKLKQTFSAAYRIILEKSDAPNYYSNLKFEPVNKKGETMTPTTSTIRNCLKAIHSGKNANYHG